MTETCINTPEIMSLYVYVLVTAHLIHMYIHTVIRSDVQVSNLCHQKMNCPTLSNHDVKPGHFRFSP